MCDFTVILPIKGTEQELKFLEKSIKSAYALNPGELILAMDNPPDPFLLAKLDQISQKNHDYRGITKRIFIDKDPEWNMQLAKVVWTVYRQAKHDKIYHFDIDHTVRKTVLMGKEMLDDDILLVSFTKRLHLDSFGALVRYFFYRLRTRTNDSVFSGNYWINRKLFFKTVDKESYSKIKNGIDTYLLDQIDKQGLKMIMRKEIGVNALSKQNEDYDWRQFQDGVWFYAHRDEIKNRRLKTGMIRTGIFAKHPKLGVLLKSILYARLGLYRGYNWGSKNPESESVKFAGRSSRSEWDYTGTQYLPKLKFKDTGTGHDEY